MRKNGLKCGVIGVGLILTMTGCGNSIPDMTEEQMQQIGEYAAITLMKYDANNRSRLVELELLAEKEPEVQPEQEAQEPVQEESGMRPTEDTPVVDVSGAAIGAPDSMETALGLPEGVTLTYREMELCDSYPNGEGETDYFSLTATPGNKLLILKFDLCNGTGQDQYINLLAQSPIFKITVNGDYSRRALTTMLMNDLATYAETVAAGACNEVVLAIEVEGSMEGNVASVVLNLKNDSKTYTIQLF